MKRDYAMFYTVAPVRRIALALLLFLLGLMLGACGDASKLPAGALLEESAPLPQLDSCALLPKADVEALVGAQVASYNSAEFGDPTSRNEEAISQCLYYTSGGDKRLIMQVRRGAANQSARASLHQIIKANVLGGGAEPVANLGDEALWLHGGDVDDQLNVAQGQYLVTVSPDLGAGAPAMEVAKMAAKRALARLP
jgi:hypothetical protein